MKLSYSLGVGHDCQLWPDAVRQAAGLDRIGDLRDRHVREFHDFARLLGSDQRERLADSLRDSLRKKERLWLIEASAEDRLSLGGWLPEGVPVMRLGPTQNVRGREITPIGIVPTTLAHALIASSNADHRAAAAEACEGLDGIRLPYSLQSALVANGVSLLWRSRFVRLISDPKFLAYLVVLVYSALRALPVMFVKEFHGSVLTLWTIDLVTAIPYTWGILAMVTAARWRVRLAGLTVAIVTFVSPYVYFATNGSHYPPGVLGVIGILILLTVALEFVKWRLDRAATAALRRTR